MRTSIKLKMEEQKMKTKVAGKYSAHISQILNLEVGDVKGHTFSMRKADGTNINLGQNVFMDGAKVVAMSFSDLVMGNGPHQGYTELEKKGDLIVSKFEGKIVTTLTADGKPVTSFSGTMTWIKSSGHFANMQGGGTYKGHFTSETSYDVEWEGEYWNK